MADTLYKLVPGDNAQFDWTAEVVLEKDDDGKTTKSIGVNKPAQLSKDDREQIEALGLKVASATKDDAYELGNESVGFDAAAAAPRLGDGEADKPATSNDNK